MLRRSHPPGVKLLAPIFNLFQVLSLDALGVGAVGQPEHHALHALLEVPVERLLLEATADDFVKLRGPHVGGGPEHFVQRRGTRVQLARRVALKQVLEDVHHAVHLIFVRLADPRVHRVEHPFIHGCRVHGFPHPRDARRLERHVELARRRVRGFRDDGLQHLAGLLDGGLRLLHHRLHQLHALARQRHEGVLVVLGGGRVAPAGNTHPHLLIELEHVLSNQLGQRRLLVVRRHQQVDQAIHVGHLTHGVSTRSLAGGGVRDDDAAVGVGARILPS
mmetsp:Transcript_12181/g.29454  ORF Transcript_12181/g.29454 Transcript_12181/m.29454 type:complete len:276 (+) Transcript_12181:205-1032(+)